MTNIEKIIDSYVKDAPTEEEILSSETILWQQNYISEDECEDFFVSASALENIKKILVDPYCEIDPDVIPELRNIIKSGTDIEFKSGSGGYLFFSIEYGMDECQREDIRRNSYPLCETFQEYLQILTNPKEFMNNLDLEDVYGLFKKIEDEIVDSCPDGEDMFLDVNKIYWSDDTEWVLWDSPE